MRRIAVGILGQIAASATGISITLIGARLLPVSVVSSFAVLFATTVLTTGIVRAFTAEPLLYRIDRGGDGSTAARGPDSTQTTASIAVLTVCGLGSLTYLDPTGATLFAVATASLSWQDYYRLKCNHLGVPSRSLMRVDAPTLGLVWIGALSFPPATLNDLLGLWAVACGVPILPAFLRAAVGWTWASQRNWVKRTAGPARAFALDFLGSMGVAQGAIYVVAWLGDGTDPAGLRGAQTLLIPITLLSRGATFTLAAWISESMQAGRNTLVRRIILVFAILNASATIAVILFAVFAPVAWLSPLLGASAAPTMALLPWAAIATGTLAVSISLDLPMKAAGLVREAAITRLSWAIPALLALPFATQNAGAVASQLVIAIQNIGRLVSNFTTLRRRTNLFQKG